MRHVLEPCAAWMHQCQSFVVALSGGLDSTALLHLLAHSVYAKQTRAIHIHHGLSPNADAWTQACQHLCERWGVPLEVHRVDVPSKIGPGDSVEAVARATRYEVFKVCIEAGDCLLTAHHQDDQAETMLLQLLRGAGPKGLAAMPEFVRFGQGWHARPLLNVTRGELAEYVAQHNLSFVEDESNQACRFDRNFLRHEVLPLLKSRWPSLSATVARSASHCSEANDCLEAMAKEDLARAMGSVPGTVQAGVLRTLNTPRQRQLLRLWLGQHGCPMPSCAQLDQLVQQMVYGAEDSMPVLRLPAFECRRFQGQIYCLPSGLAPHDASLRLSWDTAEDLELPAGVWVPTAVAPASALASASFSAAGGTSLVDGAPGAVGLGAALSRGGGTLQRSQLRHPVLRDAGEPLVVSVRFRQGGERVRCAGGQRRRLKSLLQEWGVAPWMRDRIPLIFLEDELLEVYGLGILHNI